MSRPPISRADEAGGRELSRLIARLEADGRPSSIDLPLDEGRRNFEAFVRALSVADGRALTEELTVPTDAGPLRLRIYTPRSAGRGTLVYLHGGGWVFGSLDSHNGLCWSLACAAGATVAAVDYRLAPEDPFPAALDDAFAAVRWVAARDERVAVAGDSAGAALALAVAMRARDEGGPRLAAQFLLYPPTVPGGLGGEEPQAPSSAFLTRAEMEWYWSRYLPSESVRTNPLAVPLLGDLHGLPLTHVVVAGLDPLHPEGVDLAGRLGDAGVEVTLRDYREMVHGFMLFTADLSAGREAIRDVGVAIREALTPNAVDDGLGRG
jgi:acetyl esterase